MTTYQDIFNNMDISTIDPSTISSQQDVLSTLFPGMPSLNSTMIDDWLAEELAKSGVIANSLDFLSGTEKQQQDILAMLPHSPPFSPNSMSDFSSCPKTPCTVSLFPDIVLKKPAPVVTIMPRPCHLPRIAPRPTTQVATTTEPVTPILKRRIMETTVVVDQDEIALKRQKNTDAARRSRLKKLVKMEHLEQHVSELESDNHRLNTRIAVLESEKSGLESKDISLEDRIRVLEAQLSEAHKALTKV